MYIENIYRYTYSSFEYYTWYTGSIRVPYRESTIVASFIINLKCILHGRVKIQYFDVCTLQNVFVYIRSIRWDFIKMHKDRPRSPRISINKQISRNIYLYCMCVYVHPLDYGFYYVPHVYIAHTSRTLCVYSIGTYSATS